MPSPFFRVASEAYWDTSGPPRGSPSTEGNRRRGEPTPSEVREDSATAGFPEPSPSPSPSARVSASPFSTLLFFPGRMWHRAASACRISSSTSSRTRSLVAASRTEK